MKFKSVSLLLFVSSFNAFAGELLADVTAAVHATSQDKLICVQSDYTGTVVYQANGSVTDFAMLQVGEGRSFCTGVQVANEVCNFSKPFQAAGSTIYCFAK